MMYFTSDLHLGHENILAHCQRPFTNVEEMNEALIENWNRKVQPDDEIYLIGDFAYRSACPAVEYLRRLNGQKHLIIGNHELWIQNDPALSRFFVTVDHMRVIRLDNAMITLCHYPMFEWNGSRRALDQRTSLSWLIHGHIHNRRDIDSFRYIQENLPCALNAGVDINHYEPVSFEELLANNNAWYGRKAEQSASERRALEQELAKTRRLIQKKDSLLSNAAFLSHASEKVISAEREKREEAIRLAGEIEAELGSPFNDEPEQRVRWIEKYVKMHAPADMK